MHEPSDRLSVQPTPQFENDLRRRRYHECVEDCGHGLIDAGEDDGVHDPVGAEQRFRLAVECLVEMVLDRQGTRDAMGHRFRIAEILRQPALAEGAHLVVGQPDVAANGAMGVELVGSLPGRADGQNNDFPGAFTERGVFVLDEHKVEERLRDGRVQ